MKISIILLVVSIGMIWLSAGLFIVLYGMNADAERFACFNNLNDYFEFRLENDNRTDYKAAFPCPDFEVKQQQSPGDESNR